MIEKKESVSDQIFKYAKSMNYLDKDNKISDADAARLALYYSATFHQDLVDTRKKLEKVASL